MLSIYESYYLEEGIGDYFSDKFQKIKKRLDQVINKTNRKIGIIEKKLKENGIDTNKIKKYVISNKHEFKIKNNRIDNFQGKVNKFVRALYERKFNSDAAEFSRKITVSIVLLSVIFFINTAFLQVSLMVGLDPKIANAIGAIFCAPITEETAKMISVQENATGTFFVLFNAAEFGLYVSNMVMMGIPLLSAVITRIITVLVHYILTCVHVEAYKKNKQVEGLGIAMILHALWNTFAVIKS